MARNRLKTAAEVIQQKNSQKSTKELRNNQLQAFIAAVNGLIADKKSLSPTSGWVILDLAQTVEDAFRPAAKLIEQYQKDAQARISEILEPYEDKSLAINDTSVKAEVDALNEEFVKKATEIYELAVSIEFQPLPKNIFVDERNNPVALGLDVQHAFRPFMQ